MIPNTAGDAQLRHSLLAACSGLLHSLAKLRSSGNKLAQTTVTRRNIAKTNRTFKNNCEIHLLVFLRVT